jgi:hypothetical protein
MSHEHLLLLSITGWATVFLLSQQTTLWCIRVVRDALSPPAITGYIAATPVFLGRLTFTFICVVCVIMDLRYTWHLAVFLVPDLAQVLPPF